MARPKVDRPKVERADRVSLRNQIYESLKQGILSGAFVPGKLASIRGLAETVGSSPIPVREALQSLVTQGALEFLPNGSVAVPQMTRSRFEELRNVRIVVEGYAAELAAENITREEIALLEKEFEILASAAREGNFRGFLEHNQALRFTLYRAARSDILMAIIESLWLQFGPYLNLLEGSGVYGRECYPDLIEALKLKDSAAARKALINDNTSAADFIVDFLP